MMVGFDVVAAFVGFRRGARRARGGSSPPGSLLDVRGGVVPDDAVRRERERRPGVPGRGRRVLPNRSARGVEIVLADEIVLARLARVGRRRRGPRPQAAAGIILGRVRIRGRRGVVRAAAAAERGGPRARREARALGEPAGVGGGAVGVSRAISVGVGRGRADLKPASSRGGGRAARHAAAAAAGDLERARSRRGGGAVAGAAVAVAAAVRPARVLRVERGARRAAHGEGRGARPAGGGGAVAPRGARPAAVRPARGGGVERRGGAATGTAVHRRLRCEGGGSGARAREDGGGRDGGEASEETTALSRPTTQYPGRFVFSRARARAMQKFHQEE